MAGILFTIIINPLIQIIELCYLLVYRVFRNPGIALLGVSVAVSVLTLPLYFFAEKHQQKERDLQKRMKPKIDKIKAVFKGDEQYMVLSTYYRQNHYHPVFALRNTFGLLIQIPFFIAAYSYLSHSEILRSIPFLLIKDLGNPDALFHGINILPLAMTAINIVSGAIYTKGLGAKDKIQLYGMAIVFLVLLYNSPAALVLYWTMNNIFSLVKNILQKTKHAKKIIYIALCIGIFLADVFLIFFHHGYWLKRLIVGAAISCVFFLPLLAALIAKIKQAFYNSLVLSDLNFWKTRIFVLSSLLLFLLAGFVIPSSLIASSVLEFSFIEPYSSPLPFIAHTALQAAGLFIFWPLCIYFLFSKKIKIGLTIFTLAFGIAALINTFLVSENFGFLTNTMIFSDPKPIFSHYNAVVLNLGAIILGIAVLVFLLLSKWKKIIFFFVSIAVLSLAGFGIFNTGKIITEFRRLQEEKERAVSVERIEPIYDFSQTGKNVLFIMLDRGISGYIETIFEEKKEMYASFSGFTLYPNCASFAGHTLVGAPALYGGYEYTPRAVNERSDVTILEKHKEAYLLMPLLFANAGYSVTVTDPPFDNYQMSNMEVYANYPQIKALNVRNSYSAYWSQRHPNVSGLVIPDLLKNTLLRFSFFKMAPLAFRLFIYDAGEWLSTANLNRRAKSRGGLTPDAITDYAYLDLLPSLTSQNTSSENKFMMIYAHLPHSPAFFQAPDYTPAQNVTDRGNGPYSNEDHYHVNMASFLLLEKWFSLLKEKGVYDNTKIIIVADHGTGDALKGNPRNILLPNGEHLSAYNPLLMVKDFYAQGDLAIDNTFMTNADAPLLTFNSIIENPVNPFTHIPLQSAKNQGINIVTIGALDSHYHSKYQYQVGKNQWLHVKDNIFDSANWKFSFE